MLKFITLMEDGKMLCAISTEKPKQGKRCSIFVIKGGNENVKVSVIPTKISEICSDLVMVESGNVQYKVYVR